MDTTAELSTEEKEELVSLDDMILKSKVKEVLEKYLIKKPLILIHIAEELGL